jgi:hypothetical protein
MAQNRPRYVSTFRAPTEYELEVERARRQKALAEALAQQEYQPMEGAAAPIPRAAPLVKALQGYLTARAGRQAEEAASKAGQMEEEYARRMAGRMEGGYVPPSKEEAARVYDGGQRTPEQIMAATPAEITLQEITPMSRYVKAPEEALAMASTGLGAAALKDRPIMAARLAEMLKAPETKTMEFGDQLVNIRGGEATPVTMGGKPLSKPAKPKSIDKTVDLGNVVEIYYTDGTVEKRPKGVAPTAGGGKSSETAEGLRKEFTAQTAPYRGVADAFVKIKNAAMNPSAANDLALIFSYMRALDPASTVREGEFATAQNAAGVDVQVRNLYNKVVSGERLSQPQRQDFLQSSYGLVESQMPNVQQLVDRYTGIATRSGLNPEDIVTNPLQSLMIPRLTSDNDPVFEKLKKGDLFIAPDGKMMRKR